MHEFLVSLMQASGVAGAVLAICMKYILMKDTEIQRLQNELKELNEKRTTELREMATRLIAMSEARAQAVSDSSHAIKTLGDSLERLEDRLDEATGKHQIIEPVKVTVTERRHHLPKPTNITLEAERTEWTGKD